MIIEGDDDSHEWMIQEITKENDHGDRDVFPLLMVLMRNSRKFGYN